MQFQNLVEILKRLEKGIPALAMVAATACLSNLMEGVSGYLFPSGVGSCFGNSQPRPPRTRHFEAKYNGDHEFACRKRDKGCPGGTNFMCKIKSGQRFLDSLAGRLSSLNSPLASALGWVGERSSVRACERAAGSGSW